LQGVTGIWIFNQSYAASGAGHRLIRRTWEKLSNQKLQQSRTRVPQIRQATGNRRSQDAGIESALPLKQKETDPGSRKKPDETDVSGNESMHAPASERKEPIAQQNAYLATSQRSGLETQLKNEQVKWFMIVVNPEEKQDGLQWEK
jgi:hypothetical protein